MFADAFMTELEGVEAASISMRPALGDVTRVRFDDGAARQAPASSATVETWRLRGLVKPGRLEQFRSWADAQGAGWFDFLAGPQPGAGDYYMQGRFVGGAGRVSYQQTAARAGATRWTAEMEIERRPLNATKGNLIFWPHYAEIKSDLALGSTLQAERTGFQGAGVARQAAREDAPWRAERLTAMVDDDRLFEFLHWLRSNRTGWIWLPAGDGGAWRARIAGGYGGVALRQVGTRAGAAPRWEASLTLETPAPVEVKANVGRSIFAPAVALGDASRVYLRARLNCRIQLFNRQCNIWGLVAGHSPGQQLEFEGLPGKFITGGAPAYLSTLDIRFSWLWRLRLIAPGHADGNVAGPQLTLAARRGLAFIIAWGGLALPMIIGDRDASEPYRVHGFQNYFVGLAGGPLNFSRVMIDHGVFRGGGMDFAVAWNAPGAGGTGFLRDFYTTRGGAAAP